ncbi:TetR family transcriptional regulator [Rhodobacterales bacterium HKCCE3408]|nr:TetR family transcriptional regulator [Rhodobacterales bacterium HKCCE3408]
MSAQISRSRETVRSPETRERILRATEDFLAQYGLDVSIRAVTDEAGANVAAVNYHFGSKEGLLRAVLEDLAEPLNEARTEALDRAQARAGDGPIPVEDIVEALLHPYIIGPKGRENAGMIFLRIALMNRVRPTELGRALIREYLEPAAQRLLQAMREAMPYLAEDEVQWRYHFTISTMLAALADMEVGGRFHTLSKGVCDVTDKEEIMRQMVRFLSAGLRAPSGSGDRADMRKVEELR